MIKQIATSMCLVGLLAAAMPNVAFADSKVVTGAGPNCAPTGNIDMSMRSTLQIRKTPPNAYDEVPAGQMPYGPVDGMQFRLQKVNIDFSTVEARQKAMDMTVDQARDAGLSGTRTQLTNASGVAEFTGLEPGLYLLDEQVPDDGQFDYRPSRPMLVMMPLIGDPVSCAFSYDSVVITKPDRSTPPPTTPPSTTPQVPPTTPPGTTPGTTPVTSPPSPGTTTTPVAPPGEGVPPQERPGDSPDPARSGLAETGASVLGFIIAGVVLIIAGSALFSRRVRTDRKAK